MNKRNDFTTPKGTVLPILDLRGKEYLEVKYRIVWFREDHPDWTIETELIHRDKDSACAKSTIKNESGRIISTSHKFENVQGFGDFIEKAETGSIGRALALIGYGTQFCADELDEGKRIVDSPVDRKPQSQAQKNVAAINEVVSEVKYSGVPKDESVKNDFKITFGRKFQGKWLSQLPKKEVEGYVEWLENTSRDGPPSQHTISLREAMNSFYK